jgi:hypothetical protein
MLSFSTICLASTAGALPSLRGGLNQDKAKERAGNDALESLLRLDLFPQIVIGDEFARLVSQSVSCGCIAYFEVDAQLPDDVFYCEGRIDAGADGDAIVSVDGIGGHERDALLRSAIGGGWSEWAAVERAGI